MKIIKANAKISGSSDMKYADKVIFEDIFPSEEDITFFFVCEDTEYTKSVLSTLNIDDLELDDIFGFTLQIVLPKTTPWDIDDALVYIAPTVETEDGFSDLDYEDITSEISTADLRLLVLTCKSEYKKWENS